MRFRICAGTSCLIIVASAADTVAHEGMWTPQQLPEISQELKAAGLDLDPTSLSHLTEFPMGAIVRLGGCTGSFVSPQGLVATNYHCALGSIQYNSTAQRNLIKEGFLAKMRAEELRTTPGSRILVTVDAQNVTEHVLDAATARLAGKQRMEAMEKNQKALVAACESNAGHRCEVYPYYGGREFYLIKQLEIRDVRLVYAPPGGVGMFGGEADNWMWPRHTGDFSFYRAYVGSDGKPADFSPGNVPYEPKHHLTVASTGVNEGDFVMAIGYPKLTSRYRLPAEIETTFGWRYIAQNKAANEQLQIIARETQEREAARLAYESQVAAINNGYKKRQGLIDSYARSALLARRQQDFAALKVWIRKDAARTKQYAADLEEIEKLIARRDASERREFLFSYAQPRFLITARGLYQLANERAKADDLARKPGFQERDLLPIRAALIAMDKRYDEQVDKALAQHFLMQYLAAPAKDQNEAFISALGLRRGMTELELRAQLDRVYAGTRLADSAARVVWMDRDVAAFKSSNDTLIQAAVALYPDDTNREARDKDLDSRIQRAYGSYMKALTAYTSNRGQAVYPDANGTLRLTFGHVRGRSFGNDDGTAWTAFTTLAGVLAKHTGEGEFAAPASQLIPIRAQQFGTYKVTGLGSVPVNYLSTLDITGGNSGSPVLNSRAELVGLAFDGTLDSVISDWDFNAGSTRTISVDVRYVLWQMQVVDKADHLLAEMGVIRSAAPSE